MTELAYRNQRHRVVTKQGEVIETSGAMTGGKTKSGLIGNTIKRKQED